MIGFLTSGWIRLHGLSGINVVSVPEGQERFLDFMILLNSFHDF